MNIPVPKVEMLTAGEIVQLKSGGPKMTVEAVRGDSIACRWFDERDKAQIEEFPAHFLDRCSGISDELTKPWHH